MVSLSFSIAAILHDEKTSKCSHLKADDMTIVINRMDPRPNWKAIFNQAIKGIYIYWAMMLQNPEPYLKRYIIYIIKFSSNILKSKF